MRQMRNFISLLGLLAILVTPVVICPPGVAASSAIQPSHNLTPAQQYSCELLAYLLKVVLGRGGQPESRDPWRVRAVDEALDFDHIVKTMTDPEKNRLDFMVLDPNILDLSQVLFYYDDKLSLYKGDYGVTSVYPAPEILALRLFILKKMNANEKIDLDALMRRKATLLDKDHEISPEDLAETGLSALEMKFLRDIFQSEPAFYRYLTCPFLLKELKEADVLASGTVTEEIIQSAHYNRFPYNPNCVWKKNDAVRIAFLPSMTKEFVHGEKHPSLSEYGFRPTEFLNDIFFKLQKEILEATRKTLWGILSKPPYPKLTKPQWNALWQRISRNEIAFCVENRRPLVIYPDNAAEVTRQVFPEADFSVILLGKNTYRAIFFDPAKDLYPSVNRLYMDIMDIEYDQGGEEIDIISHYICSRMKNRMARLLARMSE